MIAEKYIAVLVVEGREEVRAVLADRPADEAAVLDAPEGVLGLAAGQERVAGDHVLVAVHEEQAAVQRCSAPTA